LPGQQTGQKLFLQATVQEREKAGLMNEKNERLFRLEDGSVHEVL